MKYTTEFIRRLNEKIDIVKLANQYTKVQKVGNLWQASCPHPDHNDKTPSFKIWNKHGAQTWACFGCHVGKQNTEKRLFGSNAIAFIWWMMNHGDKKASFQDAIEKAIQITGLKPQNEETAYLESNEKENQGYIENLKHSEKAQRYILSRGLIGSDVREWNLGYDTRGRITIPLYDAYNHLVSFCKRAIDDEVANKYFVDNKNKFFTKSRYLYGLNKINYSLDYIYLTEGCFDVILATKYGLQNCVCTMGTILDDKHVNLIESTGLKPVIVYDRDWHGEKDVDQAIEMFGKYDLYPDIVWLDKDKDLADMANIYKYELPGLVKSRQVPYYRHVLKDFSNEYEDCRQRVLNKYKDQLSIAMRSVEEDCAAKMILDKELKRYGL